MSSKQYPEEFKIEAVKQVKERGHSRRRRLPSGWGGRSRHSMNGSSAAVFRKRSASSSRGRVPRSGA